MKELNTRLSCAKKPAWPIWRRKHKIDWLHACAISWNLCCDDLVEQLTAAILLLVCNDIRFFGFSFFPRVMMSSVRPISTHFYTSVWNFWLQVAEAKLKAKLACSVGKPRISFAELKGHQHVANAVTVGVYTCFQVFVSRAFISDLKSDYLTWKWHPNKIYTRFLS